jgi:hypothetical protein
MRREGGILGKSYEIKLNIVKVEKLDVCVFELVK